MGVLALDDENRDMMEVRTQRRERELMKGEPTASVCEVPDMCAAALDIVSPRVFTQPM